MELQLKKIILMLPINKLANMLKECHNSKFLVSKMWLKIVNQLWKHALINKSSQLEFMLTQLFRIIKVESLIMAQVAHLIIIMELVLLDTA